MTALEGKALLDHGKAIAKRYAGRVGADIAAELRAEAGRGVLGSPPPEGHAGPCLERIYRNLVVDHWRRGHAVASFDEVPEISAAGTPEGDAMRAENRRLVRQSLRSLPRETRRLLLMRFYGDADDQVAAQSFGITATTVRTRIHRALARLREYLATSGAWSCEWPEPGFTSGAASRRTATRRRINRRYHRGRHDPSARRYRHRRRATQASAAVF